MTKIFYFENISFKDTVKLTASFESALVFCQCKYVFLSHFRFAVGSYYFLIGKQELARRYLSRATQLDRVFGPSWLAYGHSFALENEHDQAIAAYFKVWKNVLGCNEFVVKFRYFEKATKFEKRLKLFWNYGKNLMWDIFFQIFEVFSEYLKQFRLSKKTTKLTIDVAHCQKLTRRNLEWLSNYLTGAPVGMWTWRCPHQVLAAPLTLSQPYTGVHTKFWKPQARLLSDK